MAGQIFMRVDEVAEELGVSKPYAYKLIMMTNTRMKSGRDWSRSWTPWCGTSCMQNIRPHPARKNGNRPGRRIWTGAAYSRIFAGNKRLLSY